jgi:hypothetical protein
MHAYKHTFNNRAASIIVLLFPVPGGYQMGQRMVKKVKKNKEGDSTYPVNEADSLTNHHGNRPYLGCIQPMQFWVTLYPDWVDTRISLCPTLDPHVVFEYAPMLVPDLP